MINFEKKNKKEKNDNRGHYLASIFLLSIVMKTFRNPA